MYLSLHDLINISIHSGKAKLKWWCCFSGPSYRLQWCTDYSHSSWGMFFTHVFLWCTVGLQNPSWHMIYHALSYQQLPNSPKFLVGSWSFLFVIVCVDCFCCYEIFICVIFFHALEHIHPILYLRWPFICFALLLRTHHLVQHVVMVQEILPVVSASSTQGIRRSLSFLLTEFRDCILHKRFNYFIGACLRFGCQISRRYPLDQLWFVFMLVYKCKDDYYMVF